MDWKDDFLQLYLTANSENIKKAIAIKQKHFPSQLYRYRPVFDVNYLENEFDGNIFLPYIGDLNDPFDTCSLLNGDKLGDNFEPDYFRRDLENQIGYRLPDNLFETSDWYDKVTDFLLQAQNASPEERQEALTVSKNEEKNLLKRINDAFNEKAWGLLRVACFSEELKNLPMWNHYANEHKGICFEYETGEIKDWWLSSRIFPVCYVKKLPTATCFFDEHRKDGFIGMFDYFAIHKLKDWEYEKEWRLVINLMHEGYSLEKVFETLKGKGINHKFIKPSKVYIGIKTPDNLKEIICDLSKRYDVKALQMQCTEYGLQAVPITE